MEERLKRFAKVVDQSSFTGAARQLHTSQPALTAAVQKLERELGGRLLERHARRLTLTPAGRLAYQCGKQLLQIEANLKQDMAALRGSKQLLRLGCIDSAADLLVRSGSLDALERSCTISLTVQNSATLLAQLKRGAIDLVLAVDQTTPPAGVAVRELGDEVFCMVGTPGAIVAGHQQDAFDFLAYNEDSTTFHLLSRQLQAMGIPVEPRLYSSSPSVLLQIALQGRGVAALPADMVRPLIADGLLVELPLSRTLVRPITAYWQKDRRLPLETANLLTRLSGNLQTPRNES